MQPPQISLSFLEATGLEPTLVEEILSKYNEDPNILQLLNTLNNTFKNKNLDGTKINEISDNMNESRSPSSANLQKHIEDKQLLLLIQNQLKEIEFYKNIIKDKEKQNVELSNLISVSESKKLELQLEIISLKSELKKTETNQRLVHGQNEFFEKQLKELNLVNDGYKKEKSLEIESLREENRRIKHELSMILNLKKDLITKNTSLQKENQELKDSKNSANQVLEKNTRSLQNDISSQKQQIDHFKRLASEAELHSKKLQDSIDILKRDYHFMCTGIEEFEKKTQFQHSQLMNEIEYLKLENSQLKNRGLGDS